MGAVRSVYLHFSSLEIDLPFFRRFAFAGHEAFRTIVPTERDRIPINASTGIYPILCYAPFVFLAYLSRRADTYLIRLLLLPSTITAILVASYRFTWAVPELNVYNWGQCAFIILV